MLEDNLQGLSMLLVHGEQEKRKHDRNHHHRCESDADRVFGQEKHRQAANRADAETNDLTLGQAEEKLGFDFRQILGYRYICHGLYASSHICQ